jgi:hypothetical protein
VTDAQGSLAAYIAEVQSQSKPFTPPNKASMGPVRGVFAANNDFRVGILNGSHKTLSDDESIETILVFPDYKVVTEVPRSLDGAKDLWKNTLDSSRGSTQDSTFKSWVLPYSCVILICES